MDLGLLYADSKFALGIPVVVDFAGTKVWGRRAVGATGGLLS